VAGTASGVGVMGLTGDELAAFVTRSCERQGVPVFVTDAAVLARVTALLGAGPPAPPKAGGRPAPSKTPHQLDPVRIERTSARGTGSDDGVIEDRRHDRRLAGEVQSGPPAA